MVMNEYEEVVLVNKQDIRMGVAEKLFAHQEGLLHRAFSVFIFRFNENTNNVELLLQQRHKDKYHSGTLWSNTCCSHPRDNETIIAAGKRRLREELGIHLDELHNLGYFIYKTEFDNSLVEHELDHVLVGVLDTLKKGSEDLKDYIKPNSKEIMDWRWVDLKTFEKDVKQIPNFYSSWLNQAYSIVKRKNFILKEKLNLEYSL